MGSLDISLNEGMNETFNERYNNDGCLSFVQILRTFFDDYCGAVDPLYLELIYSLSKCIRKRFCLHLLSLGQIHTDVYIYTVLERGGKSLDGIN